MDTEKAKNYKVKVTKNGPLIVTGGVPLSEQIIKIDEADQCHGWQEGKVYPVQQTYSLCRCGKSSKYPFCDGTHAKINFDGTETADRSPYASKAKKISGPALELTDYKKLCSVARFCHRAGGTWKLTRKSDKPENRQAAIEEAMDCPSGRIVAWDKAGKAFEPEFEPSIGLVLDPQMGNNGPVWVRGYIPIESADGFVYETRNRVTLCRCGKSANKPFCDGSHTEK